jgi:hypothetical protein
MLRIYKHYNFGFGVKVSFSSRPGDIASKDDFYTINQNLLVMETSLNIMNNSVYSGNVVPSSLPTRFRAIIANSICKNGEEWTFTFSRYNSGTYNNQWMIIDRSKLQSSSFKDVLWIVEQIPGKTVSTDVSSVLLEKKYWASYNVPYFTSLFIELGYAEYAKILPLFYSYENSSRAQIFRRESESITSLDALKKLMRFNKWKTDPYSEESPAFAIASRFDLFNLMPNGMIPSFDYGATDAKVTSMKDLVPNHIAYVVSGPTSDDQPVFSWTQFPNSPHRGHPKLFNFSYIDTAPHKFPDSAMI